ncbi:DUF4142 domain-containing protein [Granulicella sibirica]|uniref:Putative exported protein n=1 Tax=Granulicella sibirica TaxID=2479048 RepID=A0A4V1L5C4_9BACT|nr:DUF4142 domain-containing protein [Granulicella sibirica]RXH55274.1 putative exported protein [Granulicella sibirica]
MQSMCVPRILFGAVLVLSPGLALAQNDPSEAPIQQSQREQQQPGAHANAQPQLLPQDSSGVPGMTGQQMKDKIFLRKSAEGGIAEVKFGQLAAEKAGSEDVKTFGSRMVTDHTLLNDEMKPIADSIGVRLPKTMNKMDQAEYEKLSALTGDDFDKEYLADMVKDHRKDLREFHEEATSTNDPTLKAAVEKGEGIIREHTHMVMKIAREKGIAVPPPGKPNAPTP